MENTLNTIDNLFAEVLTKLSTHNEIFIEFSEEFEEYLHEGDIVYEGDYQVYSNVDKHGYFIRYAIMEMKEGNAYLISLDEEANKLTVPLNHFGMGELYDLAKLCTF